VKMSIITRDRENEKGCVSNGDYQRTHSLIADFNKNYRVYNFAQPARLALIILISASSFVELVNWRHKLKNNSLVVRTICDARGRNVWPAALLSHYTFGFKPCKGIGVNSRNKWQIIGISGKNIGNSHIISRELQIWLSFFKNKFIL
jgi:hypothetical protein